MEKIKTFSKMAAYKEVAVHYTRGGQDSRWPENPVLVSTKVQKQKYCPICRKTYEPLLYGPGLLVRAHHHHPGDSGGIYVWDRLPCVTGFVVITGTIQGAVVRFLEKGSALHGWEFLCGDIVQVGCGFCFSPATEGNGWLDGTLLCRSCTAIGIPSVVPLVWELRSGRLYFQL